MPDATPPPASPALPLASIRPSKRSWLLWIVPLGAVLLCAWFVYHDYIASGPAITIYFEDVEGLEEQNTPIRYRGAEVGRVKRLQLTKSRAQVQVKARLNGDAGNLARAGSIFWIVRPEVRVGGISGLRTLVSGEYISVLPGDGPRTNIFVGAAREPSEALMKGLEIALLTPHLGALQEQSPIYYRGIEVGQVVAHQLGPDARFVIVRGVIRKEYAPLVRMNSKFWNAGGLDVRFGLIHGVQVAADSIKTLLGGGIEFATPPAPEAAATQGMTFQLYDKPEDEWKKWAPSIKLNLPERAPATPATSLNTQP